MNNMIVLDTNVVSEMMRQYPSVQVIQWLDQQETALLYITSITISEISYGIHVLPDGKRRDSIEIAFHKTIQEAFKHRILSFDESSAYLYGEIMGIKKESGKPMSILDGQIASITLSNAAALATRNIKDFENCKIDLINPFK